LWHWHRHRDDRRTKLEVSRVALCHDAYTAKMSRLHNNANVLAHGGRVVGKGVARDMVKIGWRQLLKADGINFESSRLIL